jgi:hypothetical protein
MTNVYNLLVFKKTRTKLKKLFPVDAKKYKC